MLDKAVVVLQDQWTMAHNFYANPLTRTPIIIIWVAPFGGALHASVTTYYYLEVGASDMDIGRIGFIQSLGSLVFAPLAGFALDHGVRVFGPLMVTATACSVGCLWRGMATSVVDLYIGAGILSVGVNLWTIVLLHLSHCTPREHRSHVLSGFSVQETGLRLLGKALFPLWDMLVRYLLLHAVDYNTTLFRYRIHMATCTIFCFFGTVALLIERRALQQSTPSEETLIKPAHFSPHFSPPRQQSWPAIKTSLEVGLGTPDANSPNSTISLKVLEHQHVSSSPPFSTKTIHFRYMAILSALLIQSWSSTILTVLWPLVLRDQFQFAATEYGLVAIVASICSTASIASFPTVEHHLGRIRTAAFGATVASIACLLAVVVLPNIYHFRGHLRLDEEVQTNPDAVLADPYENSGIFAIFQQRVMAHAILAIIFLASVHTLEPSLKSILSLTVPASAQNRSLGFMSTLGGIGGMSGNVLGTWMFQRSKDWGSGDGSIRFLGNGTLPFAAVAGVLALASLFLWALEWGEARQRSVAPGGTPTKEFCEENGLIGEQENHNGASKSDGHSPHNGIFFPLLQMDTSYEMKLD